MRLFAACLCVVLGVSGQARAQTTLSNAGLGSSLLENGVSARAYGLGQAFVGLADDATALYWNPAGLAGISGAQISVQHQSWLLSGYEETMLGSFDTGSLGGLGFAASAINYGPFDGRDAQGQPAPDFSVNEVNLDLAWARSWWHWLYAGMGLRVTHQDMDGQIFRSLAVDLGVLWVPNRSLRVGASYTNLAAQQGGSPQFGKPRLGASYVLYQEGARVGLLTTSLGTRAGGDVEIDSGFELEVGEVASLRVGYRYQTQPDNLEGLQNISLGFGFAVRHINFDYAYIPLGILGASHSLGVSFNLPASLLRAPAVLSTPTAAPTPQPSPTAAATPTATPTPEPLEDNLDVYFKVPEGPEVQASRLESKGRYQEALNLYSQAIADKPDDATLWAAIGRTYFHMGKKDLAVASFEEVLRLDPSNRRLRDWLEKYRKEK